jgi:pimeloyl-ACP methyl ester carboxylesterase
MSGYVQLGEADAYYEEDGDGEPLVLLHPGLADSRAFEEYLPTLAERFREFRPDLRGAPVALLVALKRPDLVRRLVFGAGVFHHDGWTPGAIELDDQTVAFFVDYWGAVAPQGPEHFHVVKAKLDRMHREEPALTEDDLAGYPGPALVMVGDRDEEIRPSHTLALFKGLPDAQLAVLPGTGHGGIDTRIVIDFLTAPRERAGR